MKKYIPFFKAGMMEELSYKAVIYIWVLISVLQLTCVLFLWSAVYSNAEGSIINGFTFEQMIVYFVFTNIFAFICLESSTLGMIDDEIKDGTIAISFIKPISYRFRFLAMAYGANMTRAIVLGIPAYIVAFTIFTILGYVKFETPVEFLIRILMFLSCTILAIGLNDCINYICGILCFYTTAAWGLNQMKNVVLNFFSGVFIPLSFFPGTFGRICRLLPFAGLTQNPVYILMGAANTEQSIQFILRNLGWWLVFEIVAKLLFQHASKRVTVQGG